MKVKISIIVLVLISIILFFLFNIKYPYKENILYNQSQISDYNEEEVNSGSLINRNEAIKIAKYYIEDILGNNIDSSEYKMYINIYRNGDNDELYYWNIGWSKSNFSYGIEINAINREINEIYINKYIEYDDTISKNLTKKEVINIVKNLTEELGYDLDLYDLKIENKFDYNNYSYNNQKINYEICKFTNKNNKNDKFEITIDTKGQFITRYERNPSREV